jgi:hypothetical protein
VKYAIVPTFLLITLIASCAQGQQSTVGLPQGFVEDSIAYKPRLGENAEGIAAIGKVQAAYKKLETRYVTPLGKTKTLIEEVIYFARNGDTVSILGRVTKEGAFDSKGVMIKKFGDLVARQIYGISENIVRTPFLPALVVLDGKTTWETEPVISIGIDAKKGTIYEYKPPLK